MEARVHQRPQPRVSIALPVYNGERTVLEALESLAAQSYRAFEVLIFDNASTDRTGEICQAFAQTHANVVYRRNDRNLGAAANYNLALQTARGELFKWMACDDVLHPDFLATCVDWLDHGGDRVVLVFPKRSFVDSEGAPLAPCTFEPTKIVEHRGRIVRALSYAEMVRWPHGRGPLHNIAPAVVFGLFRRDAALRTRGIGGFIGGDLVFNAEMALLGQIWQVPEVLWWNRLHAKDSWRWRLTRREQAEWYNPSSRRGSRFRNLVLLSEYLRSIGQLAPGPAVAASAIVSVFGLASDQLRRSFARWLASLRVFALSGSHRSLLPARAMLTLRRVRRRAGAGALEVVRGVQDLSDEDVLVELTATAVARRNAHALDLVTRWARGPEGLHRTVAERVLHLASGDETDREETSGEEKAIAPCAQAEQARATIG